MLMILKQHSQFVNNPTIGKHMFRVHIWSQFEILVCQKFAKPIKYIFKNLVVNKQ
jgi:hypothetical protein